MTESWVDLKRTARREVTASLGGEASAVVAARRRLSPHSARQLSASEGRETYVIPIGRLKAAIVDLVPVLGSFGIELRRDEFVEGVLGSVGAEIALLDAALG